MFFLLTLLFLSFFLGLWLYLVWGLVIMWYCDFGVLRLSILKYGVWSS